MRTLIQGLAAALCVVGIGCGLTSKPPEPPPLVTGEPVFQQLAELYKYIASQRAKVPAAAADLEEYSGAIEDALKLIRTGDVRVVWGVGYSPNSNELLAYDKTASTTGGYILLRNGTVKSVTASEFQAVPKPSAYKP